MRIWKLLSAVALLQAGAIHAEVAVRTQPDGRYLSFRTGSRIQGGRVLYWDRNFGPPQDEYLNLEGDGRNDRAPAAVVQPALHPALNPVPIVAWAYNNGNDYDIVFSLWKETDGWSAPSRIGPASSFDDVDVQLWVDPRRDVHAVWWSNAPSSRVWYAKYVNGSWTPAEPLSPPDMVARSPSFLYAPNGELWIRWENWSVQPVRHCSFLKERFDP